MAGSGPAPNPASRRQTGAQSSSWLDLPAEGYDGPIPVWPLVLFDERELQVWSEIWRSPQAAAWALNGWTHDVALYVRYLVAGESNLEAAKEARMWSDRLGLNPTAMLKNRWRVRADEVAEQRGPATSKPRLKVVAADAVARS